MEREKFIKPFSLEFISAAVIALVNFALDQADIHFMLITWISLAVCPVLIIDGLRRTEWAARMGLRSRWFIGTCTVIVAAFAALAIWVHIRSAEGGINGGPFLAEAETAMGSNPTNKPSAIWAVFVDNGKMVRAPISEMTKFQIVNNQSQAAMISNLIIEKEEVGGGWAKLAIVPGHAVQLYWGPTDERLKNAMEFRAEMLDQLIVNRALGPKETVEGWLILCYPNLKPPTTLVDNYRITISDTLGHQAVVLASVAKAGNMSDASFNVLPEHLDISSYPIVFFQQIAGLWK